MPSCLRRRAGLALLLLACSCNGQEDELVGQVVQLRQLVDTSAGRLQRAQRTFDTMENELQDSRERLASQPGTLDFEVAFQVGDEPLELDTPYETEQGELQFGSLRYWLSRISLVDIEGNRVDIPDSYYLMEHTTVPRDRNEDPIVYVPKRRELIELRDVPAGEYYRISFNIGVDEVHNDDLSIPGGELNVLNNMATAKWMWFTSYIFTSIWAKLAPADDVGAATTAEHPLVSLSWETGGNEDLRRVGLVLPEPIRVGLDYHPKIHCALDASHLTDGMGEIIARNSQDNPDYPSSFIGPTEGELQGLLATNWQVAFTLQPVTVEQ